MFEAFSEDYNTVISFLQEKASKALPDIRSVSLSNYSCQKMRAPIIIICTALETYQDLTPNKF